jgi:hypothetical protein
MFNRESGESSRMESGGRASEGAMIVLVIRQSEDCGSRISKPLDQDQSGIDRTLDWQSTPDSCFHSRRFAQFAVATQQNRSAVLLRNRRERSIIGFVFRSY